MAVAPFPARRSFTRHFYPRTGTARNPGPRNTGGQDLASARPKLSYRPRWIFVFPDTYTRHRVMPALKSRNVQLVGQSGIIASTIRAGLYPKRLNLPRELAQYSLFRREPRMSLPDHFGRAWNVVHSSHGRGRNHRNFASLQAFSA